MYRLTGRTVATTLTSLALLLSTKAVAQAPASSGFSARVTGGACVKWDFVGVDVPGRKFYVPCGDHIAAFDLDHATPAGTIPGFKEASAIAVASALHRGFVNDGDALTVFDTQNGHVVKSITGAGGDGIAYDSVTHRVFTFGDTTHVVDAVTLREVGQVRLGRAKPESAAPDGTGRVLVSLEYANQVAVIDARSLKVSRWTLGEGCYLPKTLAIDAAYHRVLVGCSAQNTIVSVDASTGRVAASVPLGGHGMDQTGYDENLHLLVNPSGDNVVTLIRVSPRGALTVVDTVRTAEPTRVNVGVDPVTHRAFFALNDPKDLTDWSKGARPETFGIITLPLTR